MLRDFQIHRKFTLNEDNVILHIGWKKNRVKLYQGNKNQWDDVFFLYIELFDI
jgi:hypothetical protein